MRERYISRRMDNIKSSGIRKFFELVECCKNDLISLGVGEPDFITPWHIREVGIHAIEDGELAYTSNSGLLALRREIANFLLKKYQLKFSPEDEILITVGVSEALDLVIRATVNPDDEVLIPEPTYVSYQPCVELAGGRSILIPTKEENNFKLESNMLEERITTKTKLLILCYPNNPTGTSYTYEELKQIAEVIRKYELLVITDEIYSQLTYDREHIPLAMLYKENNIMLNGFSKAYAMTGWRVGYAVGNKDIIEAMRRIHQYTMLCTPTISQYAALEALHNGLEQLHEMKETYKRRRNYFVNALNNINLRTNLPEGAFYIFANI